jgi:hypothetical protein
MSPLRSSTIFLCALSNLIAIRAHLAPVAAQEPKAAASVALIAPLFADATEPQRKVAQDCASKSADEIRAQLRQPSEHDQAGPNAAILWASVEFASSDDAKAIDRLRTILTSESVSSDQFMRIAAGLVDRKKALSLAQEMLQRAQKLAPADPMVDFRLAQCLVAAEKYDEGFEKAEAGKQKIIKGNLRPPARLVLETIVHDDVRVEVVYNLGPIELKPPRMTLVRPVSFQIKKKPEDGGELLATIDYEQGTLNGKAVTAALGKAAGPTHYNYGLLSPDSKYSEVRARFLDLLPPLLQPETRKEPQES